jgi:hypothetical protein
MNKGDFAWRKLAVWRIWQKLSFPRVALSALGDLSLSCSHTLTGGPNLWPGPSALEVVKLCGAERVTADTVTKLKTSAMSAMPLGAA